MHPRIREVFNELLEEIYIAPRIFAREIGLGANDEMTSFEVAQGRDYLCGVEGGIERDLVVVRKNSSL